MYLENITIEGSCGQSFRCESFLKTDTDPRGLKYHMKLFANGSASNIHINRDSGIGGPNKCQLLNQPLPPPPPPPGPVVSCKVVKQLGCFNVTAVGSTMRLLPLAQPQLHDHVTLEACARACHASNMTVAGIVSANHCYCGQSSAISGGTALSRPMDECVVPSCKPAHRSECACSGDITERCGDTNRLLAYSFECSSTDRSTETAGSIRLLHGSGYLPQNTLVPYWSRYGEAGKRIGLIGNGNGGMEQAEAQFNSRANQMSTAMQVPVENFVFIPLFGDLCPELANDPAVAQLIESCDAVYMPGGNQGQLAACIYGVVSDSGVDSPEDTVAVIALRTLESESQAICSDV